MNVWIWSCDCSDIYGCDEYNWGTECEPRNANCEWVNDECTNKYCTCWATEITGPMTWILGFLFGGAINVKVIHKSHLIMINFDVDSIECTCFIDLDTIITFF